MRLLRKHRKIVVGFGLWAVGFLMGCASLGTYNTATGRREIIVIPTGEEVLMGEDIHRKLLREFRLSPDQAKLKRLKRVGSRVSQVSDRQDYQYRFFLIEKDELNAFTTPGGNIYVFTGLLDRLKTDDELSAVLAHEVGHCAARHTVKKFQAALGYDLIGTIVFKSVPMEEQAQRIAALSTNVLMSLVFSAYSRRDEYEADRLGLKYMDLAGYDPDGMIQAFQILEEESKGPDVPLILRTHPYLKDRIEAAKKEIERQRLSLPLAGRVREGG